MTIETLIDVIKDFDKEFKKLNELIKIDKEKEKQDYKLYLKWFNMNQAKNELEKLCLGELRTFLT